MSYKTNPIANRLSINKGFVNTFFPNNKTAYNQYLILWLSLYLFLKSYLAFKKIKLLTCEIRMASNTQKLLYISFLKMPKKLKNKKKMWRGNLTKSRLNKLKNRGAISFIYQQWKKIKKWIFLNKNKNKKKFKLYYKKMINSLTSSKKYKLLGGLKNKKIMQSLFLSRLNKPFLSASNFNNINLKRALLKFKNIKYSLGLWKRIHSYSLNEMHFQKLLINIWFLQKLKELNNKQKKTKNLKKKFIKNHLKFIKTKQIIYQSKKYIYKRKLIKLYFSLRQFYAKKNQYLEIEKKNCKNNILYKKWKLFYTKNKNYLHYFYLYKAQNIKLIHLYFFYLLKQKKWTKFKTLKNYIYRSPQLIKKLLNTHKKRIKKGRSRLYYLQGINIKIKKKKYLKILKKNIKNVYWRRKQQRAKREKKKTLNFIKKNHFTNKNLIHKRKKKKKQNAFINRKLLHTNNKWKIKALISYRKKLSKKSVKLYRVKVYKHWLMNIKKKLFFLVGKKKKIKNQKKKLNKWLKKWISKKKNKKHINWLINQKKKKLLKRIIHKVPFTKKKSSFLSVKKNKKYNNSIKKHCKKKLKFYGGKKLKSFYIKRIKNRLYIKKKIKKEYFNNKINQIQLNLKFLIERLIFTFFRLSFNIKFINTLVLFKNRINFSSTFAQFKKYTKKRYRTVPSLWLQHELKNIYTKKMKLNILRIDNIWKKKKQEDKHKKNEVVEEGKKKKILGQIFPFLLAAHKYLDAQLLAEQISRFIRKKKKHYHILYIIYNLWNALKLNRVLSYQISITGKLNSKPRARKFYIVKGHIPNQNFTKRINFGLAQAKTPTGTFGIRVWLYF